MSNPNADSAAEKYILRFGTQLRDGKRIVRARACAKTELAWERLEALYNAFDNLRWLAPTFAGDTHAREREEWIASIRR